MKNTLRTLTNKNIYLKGFLSEFLYKYRNIEVQKIANISSGCDYLNDISFLKMLREEIEHGKIYVSNNANWDNLHMYGIWDSLFRDYYSKQCYLSPAVEHGLIFHNRVYHDLLSTARMSCITLSSFRKEIISRYLNIPVFCVGSYIKYSDDFYEDNYIHELKRKLGKVLLVFPTHSTDSFSITLNQSKFIERIKEYSKKFDNVLINVFWWNINDLITKKLEAEGYKIISCGFKDDAKFLSRLKSILNLADMVIGDSIGTHIGYCVACNVPFCFMDIETNVRSYRDIYNSDIDFVRMHQNKIAKAFLNSTEITDEQRDIVDYYWGNNLFKTDEEVKAIVEINKDILDMTYGFTDFRWNAAHKLLKKYADTDELKFKLLKDAL